MPTPSASKRKKKLKKCSYTSCPETNESTTVCNDCKQPYHFTCCNLNETLYDMLSTSTCKGLTWTWRCDTCVDKGPADQTEICNISNQIETITNTIKSDLSIELKREINQFSKIFIARMKDMETKCIPKMMTDISKEVEQQSNEVRSHLATYASKVTKTIDDSSKR